MQVSYHIVGKYSLSFILLVLFTSINLRLHECCSIKASSHPDPNTKLKKTHQKAKTGDAGSGICAKCPPRMYEALKNKGLASDRDGLLPSRVNPCQLKAASRWFTFYIIIQVTTK